MASNKYQVYGLEETYPELGEFDFKIVLSPKFYKAETEFDVSVVDSDKKKITFTLNKWGRKLNVKFSITPTVSDGVSTVIISRGNQEVGRLNFWVIKP
jgi:hypothetical protein